MTADADLHHLLLRLGLQVSPFLDYFYFTAKMLIRQS